MPRQLRDVPRREFKAGDVIFREGDDPGGEAFLVHAGRVEVRKRFGREERALRVLRKGELLGELALFGDGLHSATAVALEPVTLIVIADHRLEHIVRANPVLAVALIRQLATRMREAEERAAKGASA